MLWELFITCSYFCLFLFWTSGIYFFNEQNIMMSKSGKYILQFYIFETVYPPHVRDYARNFHQHLTFQIPICFFSLDINILFLGFSFLNLGLKNVPRQKAGVILIFIAFLFLASGITGMFCLLFHN